MVNNYIEARQMLLRARSQACKLVGSRFNAELDILKLKRWRRKLGGDGGAEFPALDLEIGYRKVIIDRMEHEEALLGAEICKALDEWQVAGAALKDLCNLCGYNYDRVNRDISQADGDVLFSDIVVTNDMAHHWEPVDGYISWDDEAPLIHCIRLSKSYSAKAAARVSAIREQMNRTIETHG